MELDPNDGRLIFQRAPWSDDYEFMLAYKSGEGAVIAQPIVWERVENEKFNSAAAATFELRRDELQSLFNRLWAEGFRPKDGTGNSGHTEALKYHLEDMRKLVFGNN